MTAITEKAAVYSVTKEEYHADALSGKPLTETERRCRTLLIQRIEAVGFEQTVEQIACQWFIRFVVLRFMEINGFLPGKIRLFSDSCGRFCPLIPDESTHLIMPVLRQDIICQLQNLHDDERLFQYLLVTECQHLSAVLPMMADQAAALLVPDGLLQKNSVIDQIVTMIPEQDWYNQVQIVGRLYQYYQSEPKDQVFSDLRHNIKIAQQHIPAATQLFTPEPIVRYLAENSLGRIYIENFTDAVNDNDIAAEMGWSFFLPEAPQSAPVKQTKKVNSLTECTFFDPCMGCGHILIYAFDMLMAMYRRSGYHDADAVRHILQHNLYGLELEDHAAQLAYFSVIMKARLYDPDFFSHIVHPHLYAIHQTRTDAAECLSLFGKQKNSLQLLLDNFSNAKNSGSLIVPSLNCLELSALEEYCLTLISRTNDPLTESRLRQQILPLIRQAQILRKSYMVVCTNPPYMGKKSLNPELSHFLELHFPEGKSDLYTAFMLRCMTLAADKGMIAMITIHSWMFIRSAAALRKKILSHCTILSMVHTGAATFEDLNAFNVLSTAFVLQKRYLPDYTGTYVRLAKFYQPKEKLLHFHDPAVTYTCSSRCFDDLPGAPLVYWIGDSVRECFRSSPALSCFSTPRQGLATADNDRFVRFWFEPALPETMLHCSSAEEAAASGKKWFPYNKGGDFRKWYGMNQYVINYKNNGAELKAFRSAVIRNESMYFRSGITWSLFGFETFSVRYKDSGFIFDVSGSSMFPPKELERYILAFLASKTAFYFLSLIAPTVNFQVGNIADLPLRMDDSRKETIDKLTQENIQLSKDDWDSFETSWDFKRHPLI